MIRPKALVLRTAGTNCNVETAFAFQYAGADVETVHINELISSPAKIDHSQILCIPGGFSYGDDIHAGQVLAMEMLLFLRDALSRFIDKGGLVLGICNGFQVLVKCGLLPALKGRFNQEASLVINESGRFVDRWVKLEVKETHCLWTAGMAGDIIDMPVAHGEGRFYASEDVLAGVCDGGRIVFQYALGTNPNGSLMDIAGITDRTGQVLGLMPHPERAMFGAQAPAWAGTGLRYNTEIKGIKIFKNGVNAVG